MSFGAPSGPRAARDALTAWVAAVTVLGALSLGSASVTLPWSLWDDGEILRRAGSIRAAVESADPARLASELVERGTGRFRPAYWTLQWIKVEVFGTSAGWHHLAGVALMCLNLFFLLRLGTSSGGSRRAGWMAAGLYLLFFPGSQVWLYQSLAEPAQVAWLLGAAMWLRDSGRTARFGATAAAALLCMAAACLTKETAVGVLPFVLLRALNRPGSPDRPGRRSRRAAAAWCAALAGLGLLLAIGINFHGSYAAFYSWSHSFRSNLGAYARMLFEAYGPLLVLLGLSWTARLWSRWLRSGGLAPDDREQALWLVWAGGLTAVLLPWVVSSGYQLSAALAGIVLWAAMELDRLLRWCDRQAGTRLRARLARGALAALVLPWLAGSALRVANTVSAYHAREHANAELVRVLARDAPRGATIWMNVLGIPAPRPGDPPLESERISQTALSLAILHGRSDLAVRTLASPGASGCRPGDLVVTGNLEPAHPDDAVLSRARARGGAGALSAWSRSAPVLAWPALRGRVWRGRELPRHEFHWTVLACGPGRGVR